MHIGIAGRVAKDVLNNYLLGQDFCQKLRALMGSKNYGNLDGLVITFDSFPGESQLSARVSKVRKVRNPLVRDDSGSLAKLPSLHECGMELSHARLLQCKSSRDVALLISAEIRAQAPIAFSSKKDFNLASFLSDIEELANSILPSTRA